MNNQKAIIITGKFKLIGQKQIAHAVMKKIE